MIKTSKARSVRFSTSKIACLSLGALAVMSSAVMASAQSQPADAGNDYNMHPSTFLNRITTPDQENHGYISLIKTQQQDLIKTLKSLDAFSTKKAPDAKQSSPMGDNAWIKNSGFDFKSKSLTQEGITVLKGFSSLPKNVLAANMDGTLVINHGANQFAQDHALTDAYDIPFIHFLAEGLGPKMGPIFLKAYQNGQLGKTAALLKASELSSTPAKNYFNYTRPFLIKGNHVHLVPDRWVIGDKTPYTASKGSFPSGHTVTGQTDAILLAQMLPERFPELVAVGDGYGYNRLILGVHYPLDVIGSRMHVEMALSHYLNDPAYLKLFNQAKAQLRSVLENACGESLQQCAAPGNAANDPWATAQARSFHNYTMNYGLPAIGPRNRDMQVPAGAEALLKGPFPNMSDAERRDLLQRTATASGSPLDQPGNDWQRVDLMAAYQAGKQAQ